MRKVILVCDHCGKSCTIEDGYLVDEKAISEIRFQLGNTDVHYHHLCDFCLHELKTWLKEESPSD